MMKMIAPAKRADSLEDRTPPTNIIAAYSAWSLRDGMSKEVEPCFVRFASGSVLVLRGRK